MRSRQALRRNREYRPPAGLRRRSYLKDAPAGPTEPHVRGRWLRAPRCLRGWCCAAACPGLARRCLRGRSAPIRCASSLDPAQESARSLYFAGIPRSIQIIVINKSPHGRNREACEAPVVVQNASTQKSLQVGVGILAAAAGDRAALLRPYLLHHGDHCLDDRFPAGSAGGDLHAAALAARPGQLRGVQHRAGGLVSGGPGTVSARPADRDRPAGLWRAHQRDGGFGRHAHGGHRERDLPQRGAAALPAADRGCPCPAPGHLRSRQKEESRGADYSAADSAACRAGGAYPAGADADLRLRLHLSGRILQRAADGVLRAVPGVFSVELARSHSRAIPADLRRRKPPGRGCRLGRTGRHGARLRDRKFHAGLAA